MATIMSTPVIFRTLVNWGFIAQTTDLIKQYFSCTRSISGISLSCTTTETAKDHLEIIEQIMDTPGYQKRI